MTAAMVKDTTEHDESTATEATPEPPRSDVEKDDRRLVAQRMTRTIVGAVAAIALGFLVLAPVVSLILTAFREGTPTDPGAWSLDGFVRTLGDGRTWGVVGNSLILAATSSLIALAVGSFLAWVATRTTTPLRRWFTPTMAVMILIPSLLYGLGWVLALRGTNAPFQVLMRTVFGATEQVASSGWVVVVLVVAGFVTPVAYMFMIGPLEKLDGSLDDAARVAGASRLKVIGRVTIPLLGPSLLGVFVLMTSYSFSAFELPLLFGAPANIQVFSTEVYTSLQGATGTPEYSGPATLSIILLALVSTLVLLRFFVIRGRQYLTVQGKGYRPAPQNFGKVQWLFLTVFVITVLFIGVIPFVQMIISSFQSGLSGTFTLDNYTGLLDDRRTMSTIQTTLFMAVLGGFIATAIAVPLSLFAQRKGGWVALYASLVTWAPAAIPGVIVGLALITAYMPVPGLRNLFGTVWFLLIGFVVVVLPMTSRAVEGSIAQISPELEDAARVSGAGPARSFLAVTLRLILPSFMAGWFLGGLMISGNLSLPALLSTPNLQVVAVTAYNEYNLGNGNESAALFILLIATVVGTAAILWILSTVLRTVLRRIRSTPISKGTQ